MDAGTGLRHFTPEWMTRASIAGRCPLCPRSGHPARQAQMTKLREPDRCGYSGGRGGWRWAETIDPGFVVGGLAAHLLVNAYLPRRGQDAVAVSQGNGCRKQLNVVVVGAANVRFRGKADMPQGPAASRSDENDS